MDEQPGALRIGLEIAGALEEHGIAYALGGALAYAQAGIPRATVDVDVNAFVTLDQLDGLFAALRSLDIDVDDARARREAAEEGMFGVWCHSIRVDVFVPSIDFSWEASRTKVNREVLGTKAWFLAPEALAVFKLLFFRSKDLVDLERLVAVQGRRLDVEYVRRKLAEMMGEEDERVATWDRLVAEHMPP